MSDTPTIAQILSDPLSAAHVALDYCNEQMAHCLDRADALEAEYSHLRLELAALREFVALVDAWESQKGATRPWCEYTGGGRRYEALKNARQRLATEYGLALPGAEAEG